MRITISVLVLLGATLACAPRPDGAADAADTPTCPTFELAAAGLPETGEWRSRPAAGDVNHDGLDDIAVLGRKVEGPKVFLSDGLGGWTESSEGLAYSSGFGCGVGTRLVDVDRDGHLDLVVADHCEGVKVYRGNGEGLWSESSRGIPRNLQGFNDAEVADFNDDGHLDILAVSAFARGFLMLHGDGRGRWKPIDGTGLPIVGSGWQVRAADINGDGRLDIASTYNPTTSDRRVEPPPPAKVWLQDPSGGFVPTEGFPGDGRFFSVALTEREGHSMPDLLFGLGGAQYGLYRYSSTDALRWESHGRLDEAWFGDRIVGFSEVHSADVNDDGCLDVISVENASRRVWLAVGDCRSNWSICPEATLPMPDPMAQGWGVATGDFNGDGLLDVSAAYGTRGRGRILSWYQRGPDSGPAAAAD